MIMYYTWLCSFIPMLTALVIRISCIEVKNGDLYFSTRTVCKTRARMASVCFLPIWIVNVGLATFACRELYSVGLTQTQAFSISSICCVPCALWVFVCKPPALKNARRSLGYLAAMIAMLYLLSAAISDVFTQAVLL